MATTTTNDLVYLFAFALPLSVFFWAVLFPAAGFLNDPENQPRVFRVAARAGFLPYSNAARFVVAIGGLVAANSVPVLYLIWPTSGTPTGLLVAYFLAQGLWLAAVVFRILRPGARSEGGT